MTKVVIFFLDPIIFVKN